MFRTITFIAIVVWLIVAWEACGDTISGITKKVYDGDTYSLCTPDGNIMIRLSFIDAPELKQTFGQQSKEFLSELIEYKSVNVITSKKDKYNRYLGITYRDSTNVNYTMIEKGMAWWYQEFSPNDTSLKRLQQDAQKNKKGLWSETQPLQPWVFRTIQYRDSIAKKK